MDAETEAISPTPPPDKILRIALLVVLAFGAAEVAGLTVFYINRWRAEYVASHPKVTAPAVKPAASAPPVAETTTTQPAATTQTTPSAAALSAAERLLKEATELRDKGDTTSALARLQEAAQRDSKNANVLAEMAMIDESIQPPATTTGPGLTGSAPLDAGTTRSDADGIPDGSTFGITELTATETPDPEADTNMKLKISVKVRPNTPIDHTKVKIQVFFYDTVDNKDVVLTDADVSYEWLTPHHDWKDTNPEILAVTYVRAKNKTSSDADLAVAAASVTPPGTSKKKPAAARPPATTADAGHRKYLGYIVRIYYNEQLQSVRADPTKLLNLFPPPLTAPQ